MDYPARSQQEDASTSQGAVALPPKQCYLPACPYLTSEDLSFAQQLADINNHCKHVHRELTTPAPSAPPPPVKPTALPTPAVQKDITEEEWRHFEEKLKRYKRSSLSKSTAIEIMYQLWGTCSSSLKSSIFRSKGVRAVADYWGTADLDSLFMTIKEQPSAARMCC